MARDFKLTGTKTSLTIQQEPTNELEFTITLTGDEAIFLTLQIPLGDEGLLKQEEDATGMVVATPGIEPQPGLLAQVGDKMECQLGDWQAGTAADVKTITVNISKFCCHSKRGEQNLSVVGEVDSAAGQPIVKTLEITKEIRELSNPILYLTANPISLLSGESVKVEWMVKGEHKVKFRAPNNFVTQEDAVSPLTLRQVRKSDTFTLDLIPEKPDARRQFDIRVLEAGKWMKLQPFGEGAFPSVLFDPGDRKASALYAIFMFPGNKASVCASTNGVTDWKVVLDDVPKGMESSPGLLWKDRLWLIGGSAADPNPEKKSSSVYYLGLNKGNTEGRWLPATVEVSGNQKFEKRMGHACVIVSDEEFWVLGGLGIANTLNDVWRFRLGATASPASLVAFPISCQGLMDPASWWKPRCLFSAANSNGYIWVCGGLSSPNGDPKGDIWISGLPSAADRNNPLAEAYWSERHPRPDVTEAAIATGAACVNGKLLMVSKQSETKMFALNDLKDQEDHWNKRETVPPLPDWTSHRHRISMVGFDKRLYLICLQRNALMWEKNYKPAALYVYKDDV